MVKAWPSQPSLPRCRKRAVQCMAIWLWLMSVCTYMFTASAPREGPLTGAHETASVGVNPKVLEQMTSESPPEVLQNLPLFPCHGFDICTLARS